MIDFVLNQIERNNHPENCYSRGYPIDIDVDIDRILWYFLRWGIVTQPTQA